MFQESVSLIPIREKHLRDSTKGCTTACAIAKAIEEAVKAKSVWINPQDRSFITMNDPVGSKITISLSTKITVWIRAYDMGIQLKPCILLLHYCSNEVVKLTFPIDDALAQNARDLVDMKAYHALLETLNQ